MAWAGGDDSRWWQPTPIPMGGYYWPPGLPVVDTIDNYERALEAHGYTRCADGSLEAGVEKVALYQWPGEGKFSHAARQLANGSWASKCGQLQDIEHASPHDLVGPRQYGYGEVAQYMCRSSKPVA
jgi:hypothetical protein